MPRRLIPKKLINSAYDAIFGSSEPPRPRREPEVNETPETPSPEQAATDAPDRKARPPEEGAMPPDNDIIDPPPGERAVPEEHIDPAGEQPPTGGEAPADNTPNGGAGGQRAQPDVEGVEERIEGVTNHDVAPELLRGRASPQRNINQDFFEDESTRRVIDYYNRVEGVAEDVVERNRVSQEEMLSRTAGAEGIPESETADRIRRIIGSDIDDKWAPEDLVGAYQLLESMGADLQAKARQLAIKRQELGDLSAEDLADFHLDEMRFKALMETVSVRANEAGRMLKALQALDTEGSRSYAQNLSAIVGGGGGERKIGKRIEILAEAGEGNLEDIAARTRSTFGQKVWDQLIRVRYNFMLSSVRTHAANIAGSTGSLVFENLMVNPVRMINNRAELGIRYIANRTFGSRNLTPEERLPLSELIEQPLGTITAIGEAARVFGRVVRGDTQGMGKVYNELGMRMDRSFSTAESGIAGQALDMPTRVLEAEDAFFRAIHVNSRLDVLARREAVALGEDAAEAQRIYEDIRQNPPEHMRDDAMEYAAKLTFTNDPSAYGEFMRMVYRSMQEVQDNPLGRIILPFVRTPANLAGYALETTGLNTLTAPRKLVQDLTGKDAIARADALARLEIAAGLIFFFKEMWENGDITGDNPYNRSLQRAREAWGWRANSIRIGDSYYELNRIDPTGLVIGTVATVHDAIAMADEEDLPTVGVISVLSLASMITDRSMLAGLGDVIELAQASPGTTGRQVGRFTARQLSSFAVPNIIRDFREAADPYRRAQAVPRDVSGATYEAFRKSMANAIPGWSGELPPQVDATGRDMVHGGSAIFRAFSPVRRSDIIDDHVAIAWTITGTPVSRPNERLNVPGSPVEIDVLSLDGYDGWVYREYQKFIGEERSRVTEAVLDTQAWQDAVDTGDFGPNSIIAEALRDQIRKATRVGKLRFLKWAEGRTEFTPHVNGEPVRDPVQMEPIDLETIRGLSRLIKEQGPTEDVMETIKRYETLRYAPRRDVYGVPPELLPQGAEEMTRPQSRRPQTIDMPEF